MGDPPGVDETPHDDSAKPDSQSGGSPAPDDEFATLVPPAGSTTPGTSLPPAATAPRKIRYEAMVRGDRIGDFRIQRLLGRGSFGAVYLARQISLDRLVALKVVLPAGQSASAGEGRSLARLKHPNIVGVFGETLDSPSGCSLLWMQFVDGSNLAALIRRLHRDQSLETWSENDLRRLLGSNATEIDAEGDSIRSLESVCSIGEKLAEALDHAHHSGITHRDIKPANILIDSDGTALLADFNLAEETADCDQSSGGTIAYMAPEQLGKVLGEHDCPPTGPRSDLYSLGMVLWELATGHRPKEEAERKVEGSSGARLTEYLRLRREEVSVESSGIPIGLAMVLSRAMKPDPTDRYPSASAMATALRGLAELQRARRAIPSVGRWLQFIRRNLFWLILIGGLLPHFAASGLQIWYNKIRVDTNGDAFGQALIAYNIVVYPACIGWLAWNLYQFLSRYRRVVDREPIPRSQLRDLRARLLRLPRQFMITSALGWFPGTVLFPFLVSWFDEQPLPADVWLHFFVSFAIAGMIATTYSYSIVLYIVVCHGYRACWQTASHYRERVRYELARMESRIRRLSVLAGTLPLAAAVLLLVIGIPSPADVELLEAMKEPLTFGEAADAERISKLDYLISMVREIIGLFQLVVALIVFGAIGLYVVERSSARMIRSLRALTLSNE